MVSTILALALSATLTCHSLQIAEVAPLSDANTHVASGPSGTVTVENTPLITERQVTGAYVSLTEGQFVLNLDLTPAGGETMRQYTLTHVGSQMAFVVDGKLIKSARILDPLKGDGLLLGPFSKKRADALARVVNVSKRGCPGGG